MAVDNPRLIAVATKAGEHHDIKSIRDLPDAVVDDIVHFFVSYNEAAGKRFEPGDRKGRRGAQRVVAAGQDRWHRQRR